MIDDGNKGSSLSPRLGARSDSSKDDTAVYVTTLEEQDANARPELGNKLNFWSMVFLISVLMSSWQAWAGTLTTALAAGGPVAMIWGYVFVWLGTLCAAYSFGELLSIWPTAAGQIHWAGALAPGNSGRALSFFVGWLTLIGQILMMAGAGFSFALQVQAAYVLTHPEFVPKPYQIVIMYWILLMLAFLFNAFLARRMAALNYVAAGVALIAFVVTVAVIAATSDRHNTASFTFGGVINLTGWPMGLAWLLGTLPSAYCLTAYDCVSHLCEEMENPRRQGPIALLTAIFSSGIVAIPFIIVVVFYADFDSVLSSTLGFPLLQVLYDCTGSKVGSILVNSLATLAAFFALCATLASTSRTAWSFAREGGLPYSSVFYRVNKRWDVPMNALILVSVLVALPVIIYLGNTTAFGALISGAVVSLDLSYAIPIGLYLFEGRKRCAEDVQMGQFSLRRISPIINAIAVAFLTLMCIIMVLPSVSPVTATNMNYASVIVAFAVFVATGFWYFPGGGHAKYTTPSLY